MPLNYNRLTPEGSFISNYLRVQANTETALVYDFWSALWLLSLACGRLIYVNRPHAPVFLNLYCLFVADSGITRKSSAIRNALRVGRHIIDEYDIGLIEARTTPTALDRYLHVRTEDTGSAHCAIAVSEFSAFMPIGVQMPVLLTDLYDCPPHRIGGGNITTGSIIQRDVWINFMSASTPEWLIKVINPAVMEGGFTSRCMFILADQPKARIAWPTAQRVDIDLISPLHEVRAKARQYKTLTLNDTALHAFKQWYVKRKTHNDPFNASFETREDAHVLRVAALLCINDGMWVVQAQHIKDAVRVVAEVKANAQSLFSGTGVRSKWFMAVEAMIDVLTLNIAEPMPRSKIFLRCRQYVDQAEFVAILDTLHESGVIRRYLSYQEGPGRPTEYIQATERIRSKNIVAQIVDIH